MQPAVILATELNSGICPSKDSSSELTGAVCTPIGLLCTVCAAVTLPKSATHSDAHGSRSYLPYAPRWCAWQFGIENWNRKGLPMCFSNQMYSAVIFYRSSILWFVSDILPSKLTGRLSIMPPSYSNHATRATEKFRIYSTSICYLHKVAFKRFWSCDKENQQVRVIIGSNKQIESIRVLHRTSH